MTWYSKAIFTLLLLASPAEARTVTVLGDSIAQGLGVALRPQTSDRVVNRAHGGDTVAQTLVRSRQVKRSDIIVLQVGTNDYVARTSAPESAALLQELKRFPITICVDVLPTISPRRKQAWATVQRNLQNACLNNGAIVVESTVPATLYQSDRVHLTREGYTLLARRVSAVLTNIRIE